MPRYDYDCETCEICVEISKSYKDVDKEEKCDKCGSIMKRLISKSNFALRGDDGNYLGCVEVTQDITEIQKLEGERRLL